MITPRNAPHIPVPTDPGSAPAPAPAVATPTALSDRAGDALGVGDHSFAALPSWLSHAISTLDAASNAGSPQRSQPRARAHGAGGRRREIIDAASDLFAIRGYRGTSLRDISARVGISHPGMLHYFKSKDALLGAVVDDLEGHAQHVIDHIESLGSSVDRIEQKVLQDFASDSHRMLLFAVMTTEAVDPEFPAHLRIIRLRRVYEHIAERILRVYESRDMLREGIDIPWAARLFVSYTLPLATRDATIGAVQATSANLAAQDYVELIRLLGR